MGKQEDKSYFYNLRSKRGITLIALVVTIIVLLILAGVSIQMLVGESGILEQAKNAVEKYKEAEKDEEKALDKLEEQLENINYNDYIGAYVTGYNPKKKTEEHPCTIEASTLGTSNDQTFKTEEMKWRIWDYDESSRIIRLISEKPTTNKLTLKGASGYNNGVWALNEICRQCYLSNVKGVSVANLKRSDIEKVTKYDYTKYSHNNGDIYDQGVNGQYKYGFNTTYSAKYKYPAMWGNFDEKWKYTVNEDGSITGEEEKEGLIWENENDSINDTTDVTGNNETKFKQSYWYHKYNDIQAKDEWINNIYYELLFGIGDNKFNENYLLATRDVFLAVDMCNFDIARVDVTNCEVRGHCVYTSDRNSERWRCYIFSTSYFYRFKY